MSTIKNSVNDAMKTMRERAEASKESTDAWAKYQRRVRIKNIATVTAYVAGVVLGAAGTVYTIRNASKPMQFEDED